MAPIPIIALCRPHSGSGGQTEPRPGSCRGRFGVARPRSGRLFADYAVTVAVAHVRIGRVSARHRRDAVVAGPPCR